MAGVQDILQLLSNLKEADNSVRNHAENAIKHLRTAQPQALFGSLHQIVTTGGADATQI